MCVRACVCSKWTLHETRPSKSVHVPESDPSWWIHAVPCVRQGKNNEQTTVHYLRISLPLISVQFSSVSFPTKLWPASLSDYYLQAAVACKHSRLLLWRAAVCVCHLSFSYHSSSSSCFFGTYCCCCCCNLRCRCSSSFNYYPLPPACLTLSLVILHLVFSFLRLP